MKVFISRSGEMSKDEFPDSVEVSIPANEYVEYQSVVREMQSWEDHFRFMYAKSKETKQCSGVSS